MNMVEGIKQRRSIRKFTDKVVEREVLEKIVEVSAYAPSWKNTQTTRYNVIQKKEMIEGIAKEGVLGFEFNANTLKGCSTLVVVSTVTKRCGYERDGSFSTKKEDRWESFDAGIACQTFMLAASAECLGSVVMGIFDEDYIKEVCQLPENEKVAAIIAVGYAAEAPEAPKRKSVEELVRFM